MTLQPETAGSISVSTGALELISNLMSLCPHPFEHWLVRALNPCAITSDVDRLWTDLI